jgi:CheY-like chemotaxis protein
MGDAIFSGKFFMMPTCHKRRILCIDDEIVATELRKEILEEHGYSVVLHHCPIAALCSDLSVFDLAIVDFYMPKLNGRELLLHMRATGARFPIVLLTGCLELLSHEDRVLFALCIDKCMPIDRLLEVLARFLGVNQSPDFGASSQQQNTRYAYRP